MKRLCFILVLLPVFVFAQDNFGKYFKNSSLRFDFLLGGDSKSAMVYPEQMKAESLWGGPKENLIDKFGYGSYRFRVFDLKSDSLIFSKGFCTLFQEWQTTPEAKKTTRTFYQSAIFPFPKKKVRLEIDARQWEGHLKTIFTTEIDPVNYFIKDEKPVHYKIDKIMDNGASEKKVDVVILAEGYTKNEMGKFVEDARRLIEQLFEEPPFDEFKSSFNFYAIETPSEESGTDVPGEKIYKNTCFNSTFYTFDVSRYLTTSDMKPIYDAASLVPWDQIYVLVNTKRYGGGGFYNLVTVCSSDNELSKNVFIHEFAHGFAGLGDEYYTSEVSFEDFYNLKAEPWEPNLTTLVDFGKKWKSLIPDSVPIPTPRTPKYKNTTGVFEGGGYTAKGVYSPMEDCIMKSNVSDGFCPVCKKTIREAIRFYTDN